MPLSTDPGISKSLKRTWISWVLLGVLVVCWGSSFALTKISVETISPEWVVAIRQITATLILVPFAYAKGEVFPEYTLWPSIFWLSITGFVLPFFAIAWGLQYIESGLGGILIATIPLVITILAHLLLPDERMGWLKLAGVIIGFVGAIFMIGPAKLLSIQNQGMAFWGQMAVLLGAFSYALHAVTTRRAPQMTVIGRSAYVSLASCLLVVPYALISTPEKLWQGSPASWIAVIMLGIFASAIASILLYRLLEHAGASFVSFVNYLIPAFAVLLGAIALGERLALEVLFGFGFILLGVAISEIGFRRQQ